MMDDDDLTLTTIRLRDITGVRTADEVYGMGANRLLGVARMCGLAEVGHRFETPLDEAIMRSRVIEALGLARFAQHNTDERIRTDAEDAAHAAFIGIDMADVETRVLAALANGEATSGGSLDETRRFLDVACKYVELAKAAYNKPETEPNTDTLDTVMRKVATIKGGKPNRTKRCIRLRKRAPKTDDN